MNSYEDISWVSLWSYVSLWVSNKSESLWRPLWSVSLKLCKFMTFKQKRFLLKAFVECQVEVISVYEFQTKANSYDDICWLFTLDLCDFMSVIKKTILQKKFVASQFQIMCLYQLQTEANSDEDICWVSVWSYVSLWISNKSEFLWTHLLNLSLRVCKFPSFKKKRILMKTFPESHFGVM